MEKTRIFSAVLFLSAFVFLLAGPVGAQSGEAIPFPSMASASGVLRVGSYSIAVLNGKEVVNATSEKSRIFPRFQVFLENTGPHYLVVHDGKNVQIEDLESSSQKLIAVAQRLFQEGEKFYPGWRTFPGFLGKLATRSTTSEDISPEEMGVGLVVCFILANWLLLILGSVVLGQRIWAGGEHLRRSPIRSLFFASVVSLGLVVTMSLFTVSLIGLPIAGLLACGFWLLLLVSVGVVTTAFTGMFFQPHSIFWRMFFLTLVSPLVFFPLLIPQIGGYVTLLLLLAGFGGLILSGFPDPKNKDHIQGG